MQIKNMILDIKCLNRGIPPLSGNPRDAARFIISLDTAEKRRVVRKIKKLCVRHLSEIMSQKSLTLMERERITSQAKARMGFNQGDRLFNNVRFLKNRIIFVKSFLSGRES